MRLRTVLIIMLALVVSLTLACGNDETPTPGPIAIPEVETSSNTPAPPPTDAATPGDGPPTAYPEPIAGTPNVETEVYPGPLDGAALLVDRCTRCHNLDRVTSAKWDADGWKATVERMVSKGAVLTDEEAKVLIEHLAETYK
jgi:hypothetical protein